MGRIRLLLEYDGTGFHGWQVQPGLRTVQGTLEEALARMMGKKTVAVGSGRTDAGVHALGQVAHCDVEKDIPPANIMMGLNSGLPGDLRVLRCDPAPGDFHAQRSARGKYYRYAILNRRAPTALDRHRVWHIRQPLDPVSMASGALLLLGERDFAAFKSPGDETTTIRNLRTLDIEREGERILLHFEANGFLKHMVRNITGALVETGLGKMTHRELEGLLERGSREGAPRKAPPQGLTLMEVFYAEVDAGCRKA